MMTILNSVLAGCALASLAFANPIIPENVAVGAREVAATNGMTYVGPITPGGENVTLSGSVEARSEIPFTQELIIDKNSFEQEIHEQIMVLNPAFNADDFEVVRKFKASGLSRRTINYGCCGPNPGCTPAPYDSWATYSQTTKTEINNPFAGVDYLYNLPGDCNTGPGGVARVSCSYNDAIFFVNTVQATKYASCQYIGQVAQNIIAGCGHEWWEGIVHHWDVNGKECDEQGYCIIVAGSNC
ncbi:hypothetical protein V501_04417 [Pseudogymnoascus sp. VKM F-4519 (FW-2642)]|nr:hypothetical protein V501_04417 [Pseudogymnoascus sp. VKM F-4519 (FW-2642)]